MLVSLVSYVKRKILQVMLSELAESEVRVAFCRASTETPRQLKLYGRFSTCALTLVTS